MYNMEIWKQEFLVVVILLHVLQHSNSRIKATWACFMRLHVVSLRLHVASFRSIFLVTKCPPEGG